MLKIPCRRFALSLSLARAGKTGWRRSKDRKLIDWRRVRVYGGVGGDGCVNFRRGSKVGADGGNGGDGGDVVIVADPSVRTMESVMPQYRGRDGRLGLGNYHTGVKGKDAVIKVPVGTVVSDSSTSAVLADLVSAGERYTVVRGGEGGLGNAEFATTHHRRPLEFSEGGVGEERTVDVELKTIADIGMVGFPNAGKSTLLRALSRATPRVASYPFTTLNPHIGVMEGDTQLAIADIPGLIPGAHKNKGLGLSFLRHIDRCKALLYVLDASSNDPDMSTQLDNLQLELSCYNPALCDRASLIVANKMDTRDGRECITLLRQHTHLTIVPISALHKWNIPSLKEILVRFYQKYS